MTEPRTFRERTTFVGRSRERARLVEDLKRGVGLLTLVGPSGMGKTRLAATVGSDLATTFGEAGGVWFCSLATCTGAADVEAVIARTLGIVEWRPGKLELTLAQRRRTLLILDNGEWIASELGALLSPWLEHCTELQMLVTSIVPLEIVGETRLDLGPLEVGDAAALYLDRAHQAAAGRELEEAERAIVEELVCRLDRIPLAIELAAAKVRVLPPRALLRQIDSRMQLLRSGKAGRHGSWLEALSLTWELLSRDEKTILSQATIFAGGFTYEAAASVLGEEVKEAHPDVLDLLDSLRGKALLQIDEGDDLPRFSLLESIHTFAAGKLREAGGATGLIERHAAYFVEKGERDLARLEGSGYFEAIKSLLAERDNLEQVLRRCMETQPSLAARAGLALNGLSSAHGYPPSERPIVEATVQAARRAGEATLLVRALGDRAAAFASSHPIEEAAASLEEALQVARASGERREEISVRLSRSRVLLRAGEEIAAQAELQLVIDWARENGLPHLEGLALLDSSHLHLELEDPAAGEKECERLAELVRLHRLPGLEPRLLHVQGGLKFLRGRYREAREAMRLAESANEKAGNLLRAANNAMGLSLIEAAAGRLPEAEAHANEALRHSREIANQRGAGLTLAHLGIIALLQGDWELAERRQAEAVTLLEEVGDVLRRARTLTYLAVAEAKLGRLVEAAQSMEEGRAFLTKIELRGAPPLAIAGVLEGCLELARARSLVATDPTGAEDLVAKARARLMAAREHEPRRSIAEAIDLLAADLGRWDTDLEQLGGDAVQILRVGPDATWFEIAGEERIDLSRRATLRGMLQVLVERRLEAPGVGIHALDLFSFGWPDETIRPETALKRVYIGIWTLRGLGLAPILWSRPDGYLLDPSLQLQRAAG